MTELLISLLAGGVTVISPCVLPVLPIVISGSLQEHRLGPVALAAGLTSSFAAFGLLLGILGSQSSSVPELARWVSGAMMLVFGFVLVLPMLEDRLFAWMSSWVERTSSAWLNGVKLNGFAGQFVLGAMLGLIWSPCSGPIMGTIVTLAASSGGRLQALLLMVSYGLGASIPLLILAVVSRTAFLKVRSHISRLWIPAKRVLGFSVVLVALAILSGTDKWLESKVLDHLPASWSHLIISL